MEIRGPGKVWVNRRGVGWREVHTSNRADYLAELRSLNAQAVSKGRQRPYLSARIDGEMWEL